MSLISSLENKNTEIFNRIFVEMENMKMEISRLKTQLIFQDSMISTLYKEMGEHVPEYREDESSISTNIGNVVDENTDGLDFEWNSPEACNTPPKFDLGEPIERGPLTLDDLENGVINTNKNPDVFSTESVDFDEYCNKSRIFSYIKRGQTDGFDEENQKIPEPLPLLRQSNGIERQFSPFVLEPMDTQVDFSNLKPFTLDELISAGYCKNDDEFFNKKFQ